jgi:hypothetical protein
MCDLQKLIKLQFVEFTAIYGFVSFQGQLPRKAKTKS